jgi:hypothetical protein
MTPAQEWAALYDHAIRVVLDDALRGQFVASTETEDKHQATDWVYVAPRYTVQSRVRRHHYASLRDFTLRIRTRGRAEYDEIMGGWATHLLYAIAHPTIPGHLSDWMLCDLDVFRAANPPMARELPPNGDGTQAGVWRTRDLPPEFVIATRTTSGQFRLAL